MFVPQIYSTVVIILGFGISICYIDAISAEHSEEKKHIQKPVDQLKHNEKNNKFQRNFYKRQIAPEFPQLGQSFEPQYFQQPFTPNSQNTFSNEQFLNQFPNPTSQDEEERFFLNQQTTTLNPLSFGNPPPSTQNPIQQQLAEEQRRFQQEIADQSLREQQEKSFGVPRPSTTTPPPQPQINPLFQQFDQQGQPFFNDPTGAETPLAQLPQNSFSYGGDADQQAYFPTVREFRSISEKSPRSIDRQLGSHNDVGFFSSTVSPQSLFGNLIQHSTPKEDLTQIGNWLIDNLTKQIQRNLAGFANTASKRYQHSTPKPTTNLGSRYSTPFPYQQSTKSPSDFDNSYSTQVPYQQTTTPPDSFEFQYIPQSTTKSPSFNFQYPTEAAVQVPIYQSTPSYESTTTQNVDVNSYPNWNNIQSFNIPASTPSYSDEYGNKKTIDQYEAFEPKRVKNVQILPFSTDLPSNQTSFKLYDSNVYQAYKQIYDIDNQTIKPTTSTSPFQIVNRQTSPEGISVSSLFRSKLNELKENEKTARQAIPQIRILTKGYPEFQQHDAFFDQLQQNHTDREKNYTESTTAAVDDNHSTAIFIKVPEDPPTSTVGFLFDKTITKNIQKKESSHPKHKNNSNKSPQIIKSSLVYRTPPGKRATVSRSEISKNNEIETGLLTNLLLGDSSKSSLKWLMGNNAPTTTSRPFVSALLNFIKKRATGSAA